MKILPTVIHGNGFTYTQVLRDGDIAIYHQTREGGDREWYEVIRIRKHKGFTLKGAKYPPAEHYPPSSSWGDHGWTFQTLAEAKKKAFKLVT